MRKVPIVAGTTVYYYTSEKSSWYIDPEHEIPLATLPSIPQLPEAKLSEKAVEKMRNYALTVVNVWSCRSAKNKPSGNNGEPWLDMERCQK